MAEAYFRDCATKAVAALIPDSQVVSQIGQQKRRKQCRQLQTAVQELISKCNPASVVSELLQLAQTLCDVSEYALALQLCLQESLSLLMPVTGSGTHAALLAQVKIFAARCTATVIADHDPELLLNDSVTSLVTVLSQLQAAMQDMLPFEQHHWLVLYGATTVQRISAAFAKASPPELMQFLAFACLALEADINFSLPQHLHVRVDIYLALAQSQQSAGSMVAAANTLQQGLAAITAIEKLEQLDPLPPPPEAQAAYTQAKTRLNTASFAMSAPTFATEQAAKDSLESMFESDGHRLAALAQALLPVSPGRVLKHEQPPASHIFLFTLADTLLKPRIQKLLTSTPAALDALADQQSVDNFLPMSVHQV